MPFLKVLLQLQSWNAVFYPEAFFLTKKLSSPILCSTSYLKSAYKCTFVNLKTFLERKFHSRTESAESYQRYCRVGLNIANNIRENVYLFDAKARILKVNNHIPIYIRYGA